MIKKAGQSAPKVFTDTKVSICAQLKEKGFPPSRRDDALFYIRPDMCITQQDFDAVKNEQGRPYDVVFQDESNALIDELIYIPTVEDLFRELPELNQITESNSTGWFAYSNVMTDNGALRGNGKNVWFSLADLWLHLHAN